MADEKRPWAGEHWRDLADPVVVRADGSVDWKFPWSPAEKREYLEHRRQLAFELDPHDYDPNGGSRGILARAVEEAEAEERRVQNSKSPDLARVPLME